MVDGQKFQSKRPRRDYRTDEERTQHNNRIAAAQKVTLHKVLKNMRHQFVARVVGLIEGLTKILKRSPSSQSAGTNGGGTRKDQHGTDHKEVFQAFNDPEANDPYQTQMTGSSGGLWSILTGSARNVALRAGQLRKNAAEVYRALENRHAADAFLTTLIIRLLVPVGMAAGIATWFDRRIIDAKLNGKENLAEGILAAGMPLADATTLLSIYSMAAIIGIVLIFLSLLPELFAGRLFNDKLIEKAENLGDSVAEMLTHINNRLAEHRAALTSNKGASGETQAEVSRAHIAAEEAAILFHEVNFLLEPGAAPTAETNRRGRAPLSKASDAAVFAFDDYLFAASKKPSVFRGNLAASLRGIAFGSIATVAIVIAWITKFTDASALMLADEIGGSAAPLLVTYRTHLILIILGTLIFLAADLFGRPLSDLLAYPFRRDRMRLALSAVRGAVLRSGVPNVRDIALQVEALNAIFQARLGSGMGNPKSGTPSSLHGRDLQGSSRTRSTELETDHYGRGPHPSSDQRWRVTPESEHRFVDSGFQSAPKTWLAVSEGVRNRRGKRKKYNFFRDA